MSNRIVRFLGPFGFPRSMGSLPMGVLGGSPKRFPSHSGKLPETPTGEPPVLQRRQRFASLLNVVRPERALDDHLGQSVLQPPDLRPGGEAAQAHDLLPG